MKQNSINLVNPLSKCSPIAFVYPHERISFIYTFAIQEPYYSLAKGGCINDICFIDPWFCALN